MDFLELAKARYSVRKFSDRPVEEEKLQKVLEAGACAPTAKNLQPQHVYVLKSEEAVAKMRAITRCAFDAPVVLLVCGNTDNAWVNPFNNRSSCEMDCTIAATQMMLQAQELGLGTCWACWFDTEQTRQAFAIPENEAVYAILPLGYPAEDCKPAGLHFSRKSLDETVTVL